LGGTTALNENQPPREWVHYWERALDLEAPIPQRIRQNVNSIVQYWFKEDAKKKCIPVLFCGAFYVPVMEDDRPIEQLRCWPEPTPFEKYEEYPVLAIRVGLDILTRQRLHFLDQISGLVRLPASGDLYYTFDKGSLQESQPAILQ
jgi:hypothetical protein